MGNERLALEIAAKAIGQESIDNLSASLDRFSANAEKAGSSGTRLASGAKGIGDAFGHSVPQMAAASSAIRVFEGSLPIRAVERFLTTTLGMGPALQAIFPVVGAIAMGGAIFEAGKHLGTMMGLWGGVSEEQKKATEEAANLDHEIQQIGRHIQQLDLAAFAAAFGAIAGKANEATIAAASAARGANAASIPMIQAQIAQQEKQLDVNRNPATRNLVFTDVGGKDREPAWHRFISGASEIKAEELELEGLHGQLNKAQMQQEADKKEASALGADAAQQQSDKTAQAAKDAAEAAAEVARKQAEENKRAQGIVDSDTEKAIKDPVSRAIYTANARAMTFPPGANRDRVLRSGQADVGAADDEKRDKYDKEKTERDAKSQKENSEKFLKGNNEQIRVLEEAKAAADKEKTFQNSLTTESTSEKVRANASTGAFADKMISLSPQLSDAQKISALNLQDLATAQAKHQIERAGAAELIGDEERAKASHKADLDNELELQKIKEENIEKLAELENKRIEEFRGLVGGMFEAATSHSPNAIPNFIKSQVLNVGKTITENAAETYLYKPLQKLIPTNPSGPLGTLLKGTGITKDLKADPLKLSTDLNTTATDRNTAALAALRMQSTSPSGGGGMQSGAGISAASGDAGFPMRGSDGDGGSFDTNDGLPISGGGMNAGLASSALANSGGGFGFNASTMTSIAAAAGAGLIAAKDFSSGGVGKDLQGVGALAGGAAALDPEPVSKAVLAITAIALPLIGSFLDAPQRRANAIGTELGAAQYVAPTALNATQDSNGNFTDFDARGNIRTSDFRSIPQVREGSIWEQTHGLFDGQPSFYNVPGGQTSQYGAVTPPPPPVIQHIYQAGAIQTIDAPSFEGLLNRSSRAVGNVVATAMQNGHGSLTTEVQRAANP